MSQAIKCDNKNCGCFFERDKLVGEESASFSFRTYNEDSSKENGYQFNNDGHFDLCPACTRELFNLLGLDIPKPRTVFGQELGNGPFADSLMGYLKKGVCEDSFSSSAYSETGGPGPIVNPDKEWDEPLDRPRAGKRSGKWDWR